VHLAHDRGIRSACNIFKSQNRNDRPLGRPGMGWGGVTYFIMGLSKLGFEEGD
jgi:hypothetical protein